MVFFFFGYIFFRTLFPLILIPETLLAAPNPHTILGEKIPEIQTQDFISSDIFSKDFRKLGLFYQSFYFPVFFQKLFPPGFSYIDSSTISLQVQQYN